MRHSALNNGIAKYRLMHKLHALTLIDRLTGRLYLSKLGTNLDNNSILCQAIVMRFGSGDVNPVRLQCDSHVNCNCIYCDTHDEMQ